MIPAAVVLAAVAAAVVVIVATVIPRSGPQTVLPFTGLNGPWGVAVDAAGNLYGTDRDNGRVLKLPAK